MILASLSTRIYNVGNTINEGMRYLVTLLFIGLLTGCEHPSPVTRDIEIDASRDTTIIVWKRGYADGAILKVTGNINADALIRMRHPNEQDYGLYKDIHLSKGDNDCKQGLGDLYGSSFHIIYYHQNVSKGKLRLNVKF